MDPQREAGAIMAHYLRQLTQAAGRRWTPANDADMQRLAALLAETILIRPHRSTSRRRSCLPAGGWPARPRPATWTIRSIPSGGSGVSSALATMRKQRAGAACGRGAPARTRRTELFCQRHQ
jgi:hypothetical protein